jgi:hypothetical protein
MPSATTEPGHAGYVPERRVGLFTFKLGAAGYRHMTGRIDVDPRYQSKHIKSDGKTQVVVRTQGCGNAVAVVVHAEPDPSRTVSRLVHDLFGSPDYATGIATLTADLRRGGIALAATPDGGGSSDDDASLTRVPVYVAFDFDRDLELKQLLIAQARKPDSPFEVADFSLKEAAPEKDWKDKARSKIRRVKKVVVIVGTHTHKAPGVRAEVDIAREETIPHFAIRGRPDHECPRPEWIEGEVHDWTWPNLKALIER